MVKAMDLRIGWRLPILMAGMLLAMGRRTASRWFTAAGVGDDWDRFYDFLINLGKKIAPVAAVLTGQVVRKFVPRDGGRILLALDDSPTSRWGPQVEGAGVHHHPTPKPAEGDWLYGHVWVTLACVETHPLWGVIALPLRALLYIRQDDVEKMASKHDWEFQTKHELGVKLVGWFLDELDKVQNVACDVWIAADGAYAAGPFLQPLVERGVTVVSRLRKDAKLWDLPPNRKAGQRGRPRIYGQRRLSLAKRAAHPGGWCEITYDHRGEEVTRQYKTFLATSRLVRGVIRVVIVRDEDGGWVPFFCTNPEATAREILEAAAARWAIEEMFQELKEVWGAGQQQVRNVWSNVACWNLNLWMFTLVELCCWESSHESLVDRSHRPWDNASRRPSHSDRRKALSQQGLEQELTSFLGPSPNPKKFCTFVESLFHIST